MTTAGTSATTAFGANIGAVSRSIGVRSVLMGNSVSLMLMRTRGSASFVKLAHSRATATRNVVIVQKGAFHLWGQQCVRHAQKVHSLHTRAPTQVFILALTVMLESLQTRKRVYASIVLEEDTQQRALVVYTSTIWVAIQ